MPILIILILHCISYHCHTKSTDTPDTMKASVYTKYGTPNVLKVCRVDKPTPKDNEILIKVFAASITTADTMIRRGHPLIGRLFIGLRKPKYPVTGTGFSGEVESTGKNVTHYKPGDRVFGESIFGYGSNAEYTCVAEDGVLTMLPDGMTHESAAPVCDGALTSLSFLKDIGHLRPGQRVLINGASGSLGSAAVQIARHYGAHVTGVCSTGNLELVKSLGADAVIDYKHEDFTRSAGPYDIIYDAIGGRSFTQCKKVLSENGRYLSPVLGFSLLFSMLWSGVLGSKKATFSATGIRPKKSLRALIVELADLFESKAITTIIDKRYALDQIAVAHDYIDKGHKKGNVVMIAC